MLTMIPNTHGKRSSPSGGRIRSSCGYHHQRHQACHDTCEGRKTHPPGPHPPARDKFSVGCPSCQAYFSEQHQEILSPVSKRLNAQAHTPPTPETQLTTHHSFNTSKFDDFTSIVVATSPHHQPRSRSPSASPPHTPKLASLTHEVEYELLQQHHMDLTQKHRQYEQEEQLLLQYRQQLDKLRQQQDTERQRIQQQQQVLDYQKQQQDLELHRIHQYQLELDDVRREQELQRQFLKQQQVEIAQARMELEQENRLLQKKHEISLSSSAPSLFMPLIEKRFSHSPNPTARALHSMEEENAARDLMVHISLKRPLSDIMGNEAEEASHKSNTRRSG
eukprot:Phypoly_transcript_09952.p1 GENE.Phypoly_transcript_09952~~Phypoly_transcript_09952.p1  ORF type:complete len:334 (+),score=61.86 Phypoly_transcript_09952:198-1199(+)